MISNYSWMTIKSAAVGDSYRSKHHCVQVPLKTTKVCVYSDQSGAELTFWGLLCVQGWTFEWCHSAKGLLCPSWIDIHQSMPRHWSISKFQYRPLNEKLLEDNLFRIVFSNSEPKSQQKEWPQAPSHAQQEVPGLNTWAPISRNSHKQLLRWKS